MKNALSHFDEKGVQNLMELMEFYYSLGLQTLADLQYTHSDEALGQCKKLEAISSQYIGMMQNVSWAECVPNPTIKRKFFDQLQKNVDMMRSLQGLLEEKLYEVQKILNKLPAAARFPNDEWSAESSYQASL